MLKFRNDINLLRALAIIFVVLFHYKIPLINNGYIGVDIFFVISGYLMTSIIFGGLNSNTFSYFRFMKARFKRIVPALLLLLIALWIFSYFQVFNFVYQRIVKEIAYAVEFFSNVKYYRDVGYFDIEAQRKWLLHTWSLAVEFQFYLIYPIALLILKKIFNLKVLKWFILLTFILSLASSIYFSYVNSSASYYLLYNRAWQLLAGALVFLFPIKINRASLIQYISVILLIIFLFLPSFEKSWGGFISIIPIALAMIFLYANANTKLSNSKILKFIGLWSYSIYLWHWVIYAGLNYYQLSDNYYYMLGGIVVSIILGAISYYTIEQNFKYKSVITFIVFLVVIGLSNYIYKKRIASNNKIDIQKYILFKISGKHRFQIINKKLVKKSSFFIVGDSHSARLYNALHKITEKKILQVSSTGCLFLINYKKQKCYKKVKKYFMIINKIAQTLKDKNIVISQYWNAYINIKTFKLNFMNTLKIYSNTFNNIYILLDNPNEKIDSQLIYRLSFNKNNNKIDKNLLYKNSISLQDYKKQQIEVNSFIRKVASKYKNVIVLDPTPYVCDKFRCPVGTDKVSYYSDNNHLTVDGALRLLPLFEPYFKGSKIE